MLTDILAIILGLVVLIWSADKFISGASATATHFNVSPLLIGLTIIGFGTSAPEMIVAAFAAINGNPGLAVGNALGSNITNIALILGCAALVTPLAVHSRILKKELPLLLFVMFLSLMLMLDNVLDRLDGFILISSLILTLWWMARAALRDKKDPLEKEFSQELSTSMSIRVSIFWLVAGLVLLVASSKLLVWGAVNIANAFHVSDLVIGLTIVAIGTSLPELAAAVASAMKNEHDITIGNIVGSNLFNTLGVLAIPGLISPAPLAEGVLDRDVPIVFILTIALFIMAYGFKKSGSINRIEGGILLAAFISYELLLYFTALNT